MNPNITKKIEEAVKEFFNKFVADNETSWKMPIGSITPGEISNFLRQSLTAIAEQATEEALEVEHQRLMDKVKKYCSENCETYKQNGQFCSEDFVLYGILKLLGKEKL